MADTKTEQCAGPYSTPGKEHEGLARFAGTWNAEVSHYFGPGEPTKTSGTMVSEMSHNGLYLLQSYDGSFQGGRFTGTGISGFNAAGGCYEIVWCDSAGSGMMISKGTCSDDGKVYEATGTMPSPEGGGTMKFRDVTTIVSDDEHTMEKFFEMPGVPEECKVMEIRFTRA